MKPHIAAFDAINIRKTAFLKTLATKCEFKDLVKTLPDGSNLIHHLAKLSAAEIKGLEHIFQVRG